MQRVTVVQHATHSYFLLFATVNPQHALCYRPTCCNNPSPFHWQVLEDKHPDFQNVFLQAHTALVNPRDHTVIAIILDKVHGTTVKSRIADKEFNDVRYIMKMLKVCVVRGRRAQCHQDMCWLNVTGDRCTMVMTACSDTNGGTSAAVSCIFSALLVHNTWFLHTTSTPFKYTWMTSKLTL